MRDGSSESLAASAQPAVPPPAIATSYITRGGYDPCRRTYGRPYAAGRDLVATVAWWTHSPRSRLRRGRGSSARSAARRLPRSSPGPRSRPARTSSSRRRPAPARRSRRSSRGSTASTTRRARGSVSSTSRLSRHSTTTSSGTSAARSPGSARSSSVGVRTGDTPQRDRQRMLRQPPDVLITTPESLYLLLTSQGREMLRGVETVILDEVHAVAGTKRGAHLAVSLERLDRVAAQPFQRIGLSATQRPLAEIGRWVVGSGGEITLVDAGQRKELDLEVVIPVEDLRDLDARNRPLPAGRAGRRRDGLRLRGNLPLDLAVDLPGAARARPGAPLDDRLRQQPPPRRAARAAHQRARGGRGRPRPPRLACPRAACADRGGPEGRPHPVPRRHVEPRARDRHGRRRPRRPGREPEVRRARAPAGRPRGARARRRLEGPHLPEVPRRPARVRGRREGDARGRDRGDRDPAEPSRRPRAAGRRDLRGGRDRGRRAARARPRRLPLRRPLARAARERARHARRPLPVGRVRRAPPADRLGPHRRRDPRSARARAGSR